MHLDRCFGLCFVALAMLIELRPEDGQGARIPGDSGDYSLFPQPSDYELAIALAPASRR